MSVQERFDRLVEENADKDMFFDALYQKMPDDFCPTIIESDDSVEMRVSFRDKHFALRALLDPNEPRSRTRAIFALRFSLWHAGQWIECLFRQASAT